ncbi:MAG: DUF4845 domain-containing protein [Rhodanobacter sp.]
MKSRQRGITLIGFIIVLAVVGFLGYMAMKLVPSYVEYMGVVKSVKEIASEGTNGKTLVEIRRDLMFKMNFQYVDDATVTPADVTIVRNAGGANVLEVAYDKTIPFMYNIDFLLHFKKDVALTGTVGR